MNHLSLHTLPASIIQGSSEDLLKAVEVALQQLFCVSEKKESCWCAQCQKIKNHQHESIIWLSPEKEYVTKDIAVVFEKIAFALDENEHVFFIFSDAHHLTSTTANRLLKSIEEPPAGYHFIFLTDNAHSIISTIRSRCMLFTRTQKISKTYHSLCAFFLRKDHDPFTFESNLKHYTLSHLEVRTIVEEFLEFLRTEKKENDRYENLIHHFEKGLTRPPQSGSGKLFLKWLYITRPE